MAKHVQVARLVSPPNHDETTLAELLDPVALEARLVVARERRAAAVSRRRTAGDASDPTANDLRGDPAVPASGVAVPAADAAFTGAASLGNGRRRLGGMPLLLAAIFLAGLVGGAAAVLLAPPKLRELIAGATAPATGSSSVMPTAMIAAPAPPPAASPGLIADPPSATAPAAVAAMPGALAPPSIEEPPEGRAASYPEPDVGPGPLLLGQIAASSQPEVPSSPFPGNAPDLPVMHAPATETHAPKVAAQLAGVVAPPVAAPPVAAPPVAEPKVAESPVAEPAPTLPERGTLSGARIVVHFPPNAAASATLAVEALLTAGATEAGAIPVQLSISRSNVRYFHAADRDAAVRVAEALASGPDADGLESRDFTDFRPQPEPGLIEVWLAGETSAVATKPRSSRPAVGSRQTAVAATAPRPVAEQDEQILLRRAVEQMLLERTTRLRRR